MKRPFKLLKIYVCFLGIILASPFVHAKPTDEEKICKKLLKKQNAKQRHELVEARSLSIIKHQNFLREQLGLPQFTVADYENNLKNQPPEIIDSRHRYIIVNREVVLISFEDEFVSMNLSTDDVHSLNYVYRFEGANLVETIPATTFYISQMNEEIILMRNLDQNEADLWRSGDLTALREHPKAIKWGYNIPVAHFSVNEPFRYNFDITIYFKVPRETLLKWADINLITIGSEGDRDGKPYRIEIVVKDQAWEELLKYKM